MTLTIYLTGLALTLIAGILLNRKYKIITKKKVADDHPDMMIGVIFIIIASVWHVAIPLISILVIISYIFWKTFPKE